MHFDQTYWIRHLELQDFGLRFEISKPKIFRVASYKSFFKFFVDHTENATFDLEIFYYDFGFVKLTVRDTPEYRISVYSTRANFFSKNLI